MADGHHGGGCHQEHADPLQSGRVVGATEDDASHTDDREDERKDHAPMLAPDPSNVHTMHFDR